MLVDRHTTCGVIVGLGSVLTMYALVFRRAEVVPNTYKRKSDMRILCWIPTIPNNYNNKTLAVQETWGPDCDILLFFSQFSDPSIPVIGLGVEESRANLIKKTMAALTYIHREYRDKADWFLKADDDTYVIVENLRHFLRNKDPDAKYYYGSQFSIKTTSSYNSGGGGYVMSRHVLDKLIIYGSKTSTCNRQGPEDAIIGRCLKKLGVRCERSLDDAGNEVFHWGHAGTFINGLEGGVPQWVRDYQSFWKPHNDISNVSATFHQIGPELMRSIHFLLNNLTVHGYQRPQLTYVADKLE